MMSFLDSHAKSIGVPKEFLFFPRLTTVALLWFVIASKKDTNKSVALKLLSQPLQEIEEMLENEKSEEGDDNEENRQQHLLIDHFSFEELFNIMSRNENKILTLYDEITTFYNLLDLFKPNRTSHDQKTLLNLYNGGKWSRNFRSIQGNINSKRFNITGFIQPHYVVELLHRDDHHGLMLKLTLTADLQTELPADIQYHHLKASFFGFWIYTSHQRLTLSVKP